MGRWRLITVERLHISHSCRRRVFSKEADAELLITIWASEHPMEEFRVTLKGSMALVVLYLYWSTGTSFLVLTCIRQTSICSPCEDVCRPVLLARLSLSGV